MTPFPRADLSSGVPEVRKLLDQHALAVSVIKYNRITGNLDVIEVNNGKLRYQCAWCVSDDGKRWFCMFGLDIYDWKDLGSHTAEIPARGCAGVYALTDYSRPQGSTVGKRPAIETPNIDVLDPFGR